MRAYAKPRKLLSLAIALMASVASLQAQELSLDGLKLEPSQLDQLNIDDLITSTRQQERVLQGVDINTPHSEPFDYVTGLYPRASVFAQVTWNISDEARTLLGQHSIGKQPNIEQSALQLGKEANTLSSADPMLDVLLGLIEAAPNELLQANQDSNHQAPLLSLRYDFNNETTLYANYADGQLLPGHSPITSEDSTRFELGGKMEILDGSAEIGAAMFNTNIKDLQTVQRGDTLGFVPSPDNEASIQGLELDGRWQAMDSLTIRGGFALLDFQLDPSSLSQCATPGTPNIASPEHVCGVGNAGNYLPELHAMLSADYVRPLTAFMELRLELDVVHSDDHFVPSALDQNLRQDTYTKINLKVSLASADGNWGVALVGRNLTDEEAMSVGDHLPVAAPLMNGAGTSNHSIFDRPSSVELQGIYRF